MNKVKILLQAIIGNLYKIKVWFHLWLNIKPKRSDQIAKNVIISLTSYGRRVSKCAPYTVFSIIVQTMRPEKITLWLDKEKWNDMNLPFAMKRMQEWGLVGVEYCKDVRSYTKLIPALEKYPDKVIITVDDDIYYSKKLIENLYCSFLSFPTCIHALCTLTYEINTNTTINGKRIFNPCFQTGYGGVLYPPHSLSEKVFDRELFMKICPTADDLWFYIMAVLNGKQIIEVEQKQRGRYYYVDLFYQYIHQGSRLYDSIKYNNVEILKELIQYFNISIDHIAKSTIKI